MARKKASTKIYRRRIKAGAAKKAPMLDGALVTEVAESAPLAAAGFRALAEAHNSGMQNFLTTVRAWAGSVLRAAGLPDDMRDVLVKPDGTWQELPPGWNDWPFERQLEQYPTGFSVCSVDTIAKDRMLESGELTMADHAAAVVLYADDLERATGDAAQAAACGVRLGEAWQRAIFAERLEESAVRGAKDLADRSRAAGSRAPKTWWAELAAKLAHKSNDDAWRAIPESEHELRMEGFEFHREEERIYAVSRTGKESYIGRDRFDEYLADARKQLKRNQKK